MWQQDYKKKVIHPDQLTERAKEIRSLGKTIATLNGSFDLLHAGHLHILYEASKQADVLIVALNSDESIKKYKSSLRPLIPLEARLQMISALEFVDYVTWFDETDPCQLLQKIQPNVHVNGSEYRESCIEESVVPKVHYIDLVPGLSTSQIVNKILEAYDKPKA
ncbi:MAG: Bifunctional protein HldE [Chlamydiae bacterium]|nr:Bifunctional protein HldE [Chlamydiota bacterium]